MLLSLWIGGSCTSCMRTSFRLIKSSYPAFLCIMDQFQLLVLAVTHFETTVMIIFFKWYTEITVNSQKSFQIYRIKWTLMRINLEE